MKFFKQIFVLSFLALIFMGLGSSFAFAQVREVDPNAAPGQDKYALLIPCKGDGTPIQGTGGDGVPAEFECNFNDFVLLVNRIITLLLFLSALIAVIAFSYAGFKLLTSGGNETALKDAKSMFGKVVIGFFFAFGAWVIVQFVLGAFGLRDGYSLLGPYTTSDIIEAPKNSGGGGPVPAPSTQGDGGYTYSTSSMYTPGTNSYEYNNVSTYVPGVGTYGYVKSNDYFYYNDSTYYLSYEEDLALSESCKSPVIYKDSGEIYKTVSGINSNLLSLDVYYPNNSLTCAPIPVMVYVHGEDWQTGDKASDVQNKAIYFTNQGFIFVSVNHRLTPTVVYPAHNQDVASALRWVQDNIADFGGNKNKISLIGHSSGGTIISSLTTDQVYLNTAGFDRSSLQCAIGITAEGYDLNDQYGNYKTVYEKVFGSSTTKYDLASPAYYVNTSKYIPPFFIFAAANTSAINDANTFANSLKNIGIFTKLVTNPTVTIEQAGTAVGKPGDTLVTPALTAFLPQCK